MLKIEIIYQNPYKIKSIILYLINNFSLMNILDQPEPSPQKTPPFWEKLGIIPLLLFGIVGAFLFPIIVAILLFLIAVLIS